MNPFDGLTVSSTAIMSAIGVGITFMLLWKPVEKGYSWFKSKF